VVRGHDLRKPGGHLKNIGLQLAEVAIPRALFGEILRLIDRYLGNLG
jgi:hypothetical protein